MARSVSVELIDDLDKTPAAETVAFDISGVSYEIDLSATNADRLRAVFQEWIPHARRSSPHRGRPRADAPGRSRAARNSDKDPRRHQDDEEVSDIITSESEKELIYLCTDTEILDSNTAAWKRRAFLYTTLSMLALMLCIVVAVPIPADPGVRFYSPLLVSPIFIAATVYSLRRWRAAKNNLTKYSAMTHRPNEEKDRTP
ncbi:histone-like nucleoid-structuring protein Lsr2 [Nocardia miyunensis]|uniref:histone-like nucleoid-structuring protein Lsr2 n=1 Tax=Nocardia miyunensis TaxID=282684 RepID=UPI000B0BCECB|nr:Lsr2 family protein [Nocardia miyunensis]